MDIFQLPKTCRVGRAVPKNSFDNYTTAKQKRQFTELVKKIEWVNKLSPETVNLAAGEVKEIQVFEIVLKAREQIAELIASIDKVIPYHIIFIVRYGEEFYLSIAVKHPHPANDNNAIVDWVFRSDWLGAAPTIYRLNLRGNLDSVLTDFCRQLLPGRHTKTKTLQALVEYAQSKDALLKEIRNLKSALKSCEQFNKKVEINVRLKDMEKNLNQLFE